MESLSSVRTIMGMAQDILAAVETASRNKSRCDRVANRVRSIKDILESLHASAAAAEEDAAMRRLLDRLEEALSRALQVVRRCQRSSSILRGVVVFVAGGGRVEADTLGEVEGEIDRCIHDLNFARIARLETLLLVRQQHDDVAAASTEDGEKGSADSVVVVVPDKKADQQAVAVGSSAAAAAEMDRRDDNTTGTATEEGTTAIGVPVCTVTAAVHEMVPPPCYRYWDGHGYRSYGYRRHHGCGCHCDSWDDDAGGPSSDAAAFYYTTQYSSYPSMFSDDNPNACTIM